MNVAQIVSGTGINGAIRHCYELSCELAELGHSVAIVHRPRAWIGKQPVPKGVELVESDIRRRWRELSRVAGELKRRDIHLVHTHLSSAHFFGVLLARLFGLKSVATSHMPRFQPHWWWNDRVIAPCNSTKTYQRWINGVPGSRIDVIPNFVNANKFQANKSRDKMRASLRLERGDFAIGVIGSVEPRKGLHFLLDAMPQLIAQKIRPIIVSVGPIHAKYSERLKLHSKRLGISKSVRYLNRRNDIANILGSLDCVALPSQCEVMPIALMEAMGFGLPVVATRVGGVPDLIRDGIDGFLVPSKDSNALALPLAKLARDPALRMELGANARQSMQTSFGPKLIVPKVVACYQSALGNSQNLRRSA